MYDTRPGLIRLPNDKPERGAQNARLLILCLALAAVVSYGLHDRRPAKPWAGAKLNASDFVSGIPVAHDDLRLVVSVLEVHKSLMAESEKRLFGFDLGTTRVSLTMPTRIHYAVDLSGSKPVDFRFNPQRRELVAIFADPRLQAIEMLASEKRVAIEPGWGRLKALSGHTLQDGLERGLYHAVRVEASTPAIIEQIKERARPLLSRLLTDYLRRTDALGPDGITHARVRFQSDADSEKLALYSANEVRAE